MNGLAAHSKVLAEETSEVSEDFGSLSGTSWDSDPSNRWSVPYIDQPLDFWEALQNDYGPFIADVYFPLPGHIMGSGRPPQPDSHTDTFLRRSAL